jgi:D-alanyl-D-alanine carboxypeptidase
MERTVAATVAEATSTAVFDLAGPVKRRVELLEDVSAPVRVGQTIGTLTVYQGTTVLKQIPLVAGSDVPDPTVWQRIVFFFGKLWKGIFGR